MSTTTLPPRTHPVLDALRLIGAGLDELADANLWTLAESELLAARVEMEALACRLTASRWQATREIDTRGAALAAGATSPTAWLVGVLRQHPGEAAREVRLAAQVTPDALPATAAALAAGEITPAAAGVLADTDRRLAAYATAAERADAEALLAGHARTLNVRQLQAAALHVQHWLDPDQGTRPERDEQTQVSRRELRMRLNPDGSARLDGYLDKEAAALLGAALDPLAKPRPAGSDTPDGAASPTDGGAGGGTAGGTDGEATSGTGGATGRARDRRSPAQRRGDALVELAEIALRSGLLPQQAGQPVQVVVAIRLEDLLRRFTDRTDGPAGRQDSASQHHARWDRQTGDGQTGSASWDGQTGSGARWDVQAWDRVTPDGTGPGTDRSAGSAGLAGLAGLAAVAGMLETGLPLSAAAVRRLACDAQLIPAVLGAHGEPLDIGRATRTVPPAIRRALELRDGGCTFPGCDRPPKWTQGHHIWHWTRGGPTAITNLVLLCTRHHRAIHHDGWDVRVDTDGLPTFYPPRWIDPDRQPRRNHRLRPLAPPGPKEPGHLWPL